MGDWIGARLTRAGNVWIGAYALTFAFIVYFSMYAFRKPFTAATYEGMDGWGFAIDFKVVIVVSQVLGYALSKFIGVKVVSEAKPNHRALMILTLIGASELALIAFALVPAPWKVAAMFLNGLPLGMIWGLVFAALEGRRMTEILAAGLCVSFIVSSGVVKSIGRALVIDHGVPEVWMPALTGALFLPLLTLSVFALAQTPPPDAADKAQRMERTPMYRAERKAFMAVGGLGLILLIVGYVVLTALRDFRDNFAVEIWSAVGFADSPEILSLSELPVAGVVLALLAATALIRDNRHAVLANHGVIILGAVVVVVATVLFQMERVGPVAWMIAVGAGVYMGYVPFNSVLVDRLTPAMGVPGNAAFFIYLADTSGYAGSVGLLLFKTFGSAQLSWLPFFIGFCQIGAGLIILTTLASLAYFNGVVFARARRMTAGRER